MIAPAYRDALLKQWPVVLLSMLVVALGALAVTLVLPRQYQAHATVQLVLSPRNAQQASIASTYINTAMQLAISDSVLGPVATKYGLSTDQLAHKVTVAVVPSSLLFTLAVSD